MDNTYYQQLGITVSATTEEVSAAYYRERAKLTAAGDSTNSDAAEALEALDEAFRTLSEPAARAAYDRSLGLTSLDTSLALIPAAPPPQSSSLINLAPRVAGAQTACGNCGALNPAQSTMCFACGAQIGRPCPRCGHTIGLSQPICDRCGTPVAEYGRQRFGEAAAVEQRIQEDRLSGETYHKALEEVNQADDRNTVVFWLVAAFGCGLLMLLAYYALRFFDGVF